MLYFLFWFFSNVNFTLAHQRCVSFSSTSCSLYNTRLFVFVRHQDIYIFFISRVIVNESKRSAAGRRRGGREASDPRRHAPAAPPELRNAVVSIHQPTIQPAVIPSHSLLSHTTLFSRWREWSGVGEGGGCHIALIPQKLFFFFLL